MGLLVLIYKVYDEVFVTHFLNNVKKISRLHLQN